MAAFPFIPAGSDARGDNLPGGALACLHGHPPFEVPVTRTSSYRLATMYVRRPSNSSREKSMHCVDDHLAPPRSWQHPDHRSEFGVL
jgi:hypothetical protein